MTKSITIHAKIQYLRAPVWVKDFEKLSGASQVKLMEEQATRIENVHKLVVPETYLNETPDNKMRTILNAAAQARVLLELPGFVCVPREVNEGVYDAYMAAVYPKDIDPKLPEWPK